MSDAATEGQAAAAETTTEEMGLLDQIMAQTKIQPADESFSMAKRGVEALIAEMMKPNLAGEKVNNAHIDAMISELDAKLSAQVDQILHHPEVQKLESAWRGLKYLVDKTNFRENIKIEVLNVSKDDLLEDFEDAPEVVQSGLYSHAYTAEYGTFGGEPIAAMVTNYEFSANAQDIKLMQYCASVGAMSHAPVIAAASPKMFGVDSHEEIAGLKDLAAIFEGPQYAKWRSFRESEDARYMALTMPRFLLRLPYDPENNPVKAFSYKEDVSGSHQDYLWGNCSYAFATRLCDSFAKYRWCPNIIGPQSGGAVEDLPLHQFESMGDVQTKIPTEVMLSDRKEFELAEEGFIGLTFRKGSDNAAFFSANSVQKPKFFGGTAEGKQAETNYKLGTQLPYMMIMNRLAHYIKVLQREQIGSSKERPDLERELNNWIRQYVSDQENPSADVRARRPLRAAKIVVSDVEGDPGWYKVGLQVRPHFKYMGASFELSLVGKLDKE